MDLLKRSWEGSEDIFQFQKFAGILYTICGKSLSAFYNAVLAENSGNEPAVMFYAYPKSALTFL